MPPDRRALTALAARARVLAAAVTLALAGAARPALAARPGGHPRRHAPPVARTLAAAKSSPSARPTFRAVALKVPSSPRQGRVEFVTQKRVYLDRGNADGLGIRQAVMLTRNGRPIGRCPIELLSDHVAVCKSGRAHIGDVFKLARAATAPGGAVAQVLPPPAADEALQARAEALAAAPHEKVDFKGPSDASRRAGITIGAGITTWSSYPAANGAYAAEELDVRLHQLALGQTDLRLDAALTAVRWQTWLTDRRFRPNAPTQIYLWEAEVSRRELDDRTVFAIGRLWPWHVPGVPMLDGMQIGRRNEQGNLEWGAYGGLIPQISTLAPAFDTWAGGLYAAAVGEGNATELVRTVRSEARLGVRQSPTIGLVSEGEAVAEAALRSVAVDGGARVRYASKVDRQAALEQAFVDLRLPAAASGGGWLQLRYLGVAPEQQPLLVAELPSVKGGYHLLLDVYSSLRRSLRFGLFASAHLDRDSGQREGEAGIDLGAPRLFGEVGGMSVGGSIGQGWLATRVAYVQLLAHPLGRVHVRGRVSAMQSESITSDPLTDLFEVGADLQIEAVLTSRLRIRVRELARWPVLIQGQAPTGQLPGVVSSVDAVVGL